MSEGPLLLSTFFMHLRFWEVDLLRGIAVVLMVVYHLAFDLDYLQVYSIDVQSGLPLAVARLTLSLFLLLVGLSLRLSRSQAARRSGISGQDDGYFTHLAGRASVILALALGVSAVTYLFLGKCFIAFGVLHLIGLSLLLTYPFLGMGRLNFLWGTLIIIAGLYLPSLAVDHLWLLWLGLTPPDFCSVDYTPLIPWFGVVLVGAAFGDLLYPGSVRRARLPDWQNAAPAGMLAWLGRHSLAVYLIHQPALLVLLSLLGVRLPWHLSEGLFLLGCIPLP